MALDPDLILVLRQDFYSFAKKAFKTLHDKELEEALYLEYVASQLALMINGTVKRCVLSMPPRTLKSELGCIMLSAYLLGQHPETRIMILTHNEALAGTLSGKVRRLLKAPWFKEVFPSCRLERSEEMDFETSAGGGLFASSIEGNITGLGADLIIVDDPVDLRVASSDPTSRSSRRTTCPAR